MDTSPELPNPLPAWLSEPCSDDEDAFWDQLAYDVYFNRRLSALSLDLLEAAERLLDPDGHGTTLDAARRDAQRIIDTVRNGYGDEVP